MSPTLRPYQRAAIDACFAAWEYQDQQRIAVQLPTGAGKTVIFARLIREARTRRGFGTALVLAHRDHLVQQAVNKFRADDPELRVGVVKAGRNEVHDVDVIVASVQTLSRAKRLAQLPPVDLVVVDEAHHAAADSYIRVLRELGCYRPGGAWLLGVSATLERADSRKLGDVFESVPFEIDVLDLVDQGYLVEPRGKHIEIEDFDLSKVAVRAGDLVDKDLAEALDRSGAYGVVAAAYREHAADRQGVVFCPNIATSMRMAEVLSEWGFKAEALSSKTLLDERRDMLDRYQRGDTQILVNCSVLTEGWDAPATACVVIARPTTSRILFCQMVGRGLRLSPGKDDCLVLDLVGVSGRHQLSTMADLTSYDVGAPRDGETLRESRDRARTAKREARTRGSLSSRDIDLLRRVSGSSIRDGWWLITAGGVRFMKVADEQGCEHIFWIEQVEGFDHVVMWGPHGGIPECLESGLSWAEAESYARGEMLEITAIRPYIDPRARWRRKPFEECSQGQVNMASRLGIDLSDQPTRGDLSDRISVCTTGPRIDLWIESNRESCDYDLVSS
jgi:superfamily II DNA or RNA helicase